MSKTPILQPDHSYTFKSYFEMSFEPEGILAEFGYSLKRSSLNQKKSIIELDRLANLKSRIEESLPYISLTSEAARRELLIAPILLDVIHYTHAQLIIESQVKIESSNHVLSIADTNLCKLARKQSSLLFQHPHKLV